MIDIRKLLNHCPECGATSDGDRHRPGCRLLGRPPHTSPEGLDALASELLAEKPFETATPVARLYVCRCCERAIEVFRAKDNRALYGHLCRTCHDQVLPISHYDHYVFVIQGDAP